MVVKPATVETEYPEVPVSVEPKTLNGTDPLVPAAVETVTARAPVAASAPIRKAAVTEVLAAKPIDCAVTPVPATVITVPPETKFVPVIVPLKF